jgi:hypothetical protein
MVRAKYDGRRASATGRRPALARIAPGAGGRSERSWLAVCAASSVWCGGSTACAEWLVRNAIPDRPVSHRGLHDGPKLRGGPEPRMAIAALAGRERTGPARERAVASGTAVARAADARHGARARCCWAQRIDEARQRYRFCLDERPTAVADAAVVGGAGCWVKLGVRPISAREAVPLAALRAALDLDALPA